MQGNSTGCRDGKGWCFVALCAAVAAWGLGWSAWRIATEGPGVLGVNNAVPWGWDIALFVFWIGLGHAGTLISAVLLLTRKKWRAPIARYAEWMTICAAVTAAVFPLVHVGRAWMIWQATPLPVASGVWPHAGSALMWDAAAISGYVALSAMFLWVGLQGKRAQQAGRGESWARSCVLMAGALTPTVVLVHSVVACDFATVLRWRWGLMPPFFVCGALLSGMAVVQLIALWRGCEPAVRDQLARLTLGLGLAIGLFYAAELREQPGLWNAEYGLMLGLNVGLPCVFLSRAARVSRVAAAAVACGVLVGMWIERTGIIITHSVAATGGSYAPTAVDRAMMAGSVALFLAMFCAGAMLFLNRCHPVEPEELRHAKPPAAPGRCALVGGAAGLLLALGWLLLTQGADTAGAPGHRPEGLFFAFPILTIATLGGAGLAIFLHQFFCLHRK